MENKLKTYVTYSLTLIILIWVILVADPELTESILIIIIWIAGTIFNFVNSIRYIKYNKGLAIPSLCISSFLLLMFSIGFVVGTLGI